TLSARTPSQAAVELFPDDMVKGRYSNVRVRFNNFGSAPADIVTAKFVNGQAQAFGSVAAGLRTAGGIAVAGGGLVQTGDGAQIAYLDGQQHNYVRVGAGSSFLFNPIALAVPDTSDDQSYTLTGSVSGLIYSIYDSSMSAPSSFESSQGVAAVFGTLFKIAVAPSQAVYDQGSAVSLAGTVKNVLDQPFPGMPVSLTVGARGYERSFSAVADSSGAFTADFTPSYGESGLYTVTGGVATLVSKTVLSTFTIAGFGLNYSEYNVTLPEHASQSFTVNLSNTGETPLEGLSAELEHVSGGCADLTLGTTVPATLAAGLRLPLTLTASGGEAGTCEYALKITESHGFERRMPVHITARTAEAGPKVTPQAFELGLKAGEVRTQVVTVENVGYSTWTEVQVGAPTLEWVSVAGSSYLGNIPPGGNRSFTIMFAPPEGLASGAYARYMESGLLENYT
ncbi:MAG TPA: hypothetical protein PLL10_00790, partial [Elusimicrobiales bacterium]|nr:hypothetical protein [Elusimicrobiales bacterium]